MTPAHILVVDDEKNIRRTLCMVLEGEDYEVNAAENAEDALKCIAEESFDVILLDVQMGGMSGLQLLEKIKESDNTAEIIMMSGHASLSDAVNATRLGAFDFLEKPIERERLLLTVRNSLEKHALALKVQALESGKVNTLGMIGESAAMQKVRNAVKMVAPTKGKVLILGESGVGKDLVARAIHDQSDRSKQAFVKVNCSAIPSELIESELFGHEKGAFTGAAQRKRGLFELANNGTIFLDEIGDMSLAAQAKVLRVLQNGEITRVGSEKLSYVDVRVIAATNKDLKSAVDAGTFRQDLYFRLNVVPIYVPPLRERLEDVPLLANAFLSQIAKEYARKPMTISPKAMQYLCTYDYPGNIRELRNLCERFIIMASDPISPSDLPEDMLVNVDEPLTTTPVTTTTAQSISSIFEPGSHTINDFRLITESAYIKATLDLYSWNVSKTAEVLGMERTNLHKKIKKYALERTED